MSNGELRGLFSEKSIWEIVDTYKSVFPSPLPNTRLGIGCAIVIAFMVYWFSKTDFEFQLLQHANDALVGFALVLASTSLGLIVAGFSIFASGLDSKSFKKLASTNLNLPLFAGG